MKETVVDFYNRVGRKKTYWIPLLILAVGAFGFSLASRTLSIDDLMVQYYLSGDAYMISGGFWGSAVVQRLFGCAEFSPFFAKFASVILFLADGFLLGALFFRLNGGRSGVLPYTILAGGMLTYPLITEIWEYYGAAFLYLLTLLLVVLVCLIFTSELSGKKKLLWGTVLMLGAECITLVTTFVYISVVCMVLFYRYAMENRENHPIWKWIPEGLGYVLPLAAGIAFRLVMQVLLQTLFAKDFDPYSNVRISSGIMSTLKAFLYNGFSYGFEGLLYFPITVLDFSLLAFLVISLVRCRKLRSPVPFLIALCVFLSLFSQSILQGQRLPFRHALAMSVFVGFLLFLLAEAAQRNPRQWIRRGTAAALLLLCWNQASYTNRMLELNNLRSDNELAVVRNLGFRLTADYDRKPVAFVGRGSEDLGWSTRQVTLDPDSPGGRVVVGIVNLLGDRLPADGGIAEDLTRIESLRYTQTNVQSLLRWAETVPDMMAETFSYCGYDIPVVDVEKNYDTFCMLWDRAAEAELGLYDILDTGDYLVVCMGDLTAPH